MKTQKTLAPGPPDRNRKRQNAGMCSPQGDGHRETWDREPRDGCSLGARSHCAAMPRLDVSPGSPWGQRWC